MDQSFFNQRIRWSFSILLLGLMLAGEWVGTSYGQDLIQLPPPVEAIHYETELSTTQLCLAEVDPLATPVPPVVSKASFDFQNGMPSDYDWLNQVRCGYDDGFVIASERRLDLGVKSTPFLLRLNGWGQLRHTDFNSQGTNPDQNQFQLKRARIVFSGSAFHSRF